MQMVMPIADCDVDGADQVDRQDGKDEEVHGRIVAAVVFEGLWSRHWRNPFEERFVIETFGIAVTKWLFEDGRLAVWNGEMIHGR